MCSWLSFASLTKEPAEGGIVRPAKHRSDRLSTDLKINNKKKFWSARLSEVKKETERQSQLCSEMDGGQNEVSPVNCSLQCLWAWLIAMNGSQMAYC